MMNKYMYTDKQLNKFNQGPNVYSVNTQFVQRKENRTNIVTAKSDNELKQGEINTITTSDNQEFRGVATKSDIETDFDGLAVSPIVNGKPDYKNVAVIAAGTDPGSPTMIDRCKITFSYYSVIQTNLSYSIIKRRKA